MGAVDLLGRGLKTVEGCGNEWQESIVSRVNKWKSSGTISNDSNIGVIFSMSKLFSKFPSYFIQTRNTYFKDLEEQETKEIACGRW